MRDRPLGSPRLHLRLTASTNDVARELAALGAPHGTLVTAAEQSAGRGRQGRSWTAPAGRALLCSIVLREPPRLLSLIAGVAVAELVDELVPPAGARIKWPNDVLLDGRKVAGILVEGRPAEQWSVLGIGINIALGDADLPPDLRAHAGTLGLEPTAIEPALARLLDLLQGWLGSPDERRSLLAIRARDELRGHRVRWSRGGGIGAGIDNDGRLLVDTGHGSIALDAGEVHLLR